MNNDIELKLFEVMFAVHKDRQYTACGGFIFAKSADDIENILNEKYGNAIIRTIREVPIEMGLILYGTRWTAVK